MYLFLVLHSLTVVEFQRMNVNIQSILVVSTIRPLQYTFKTDKDWSKGLLCWSGPTWSSTIKVKWVCPIHRGEEDWSCFLVVYVCIWEKMRPLVQKAAIVVCPTQRGGEKVVTHISSQYWQHPGEFHYAYHKGHYRIKDVIASMKAERGESSSIAII